MRRLRPPLDPNDHFLGDPTAGLSLVEFGDYECPFCGQAYPITRRLQKVFGPDRLCFVFRHFPPSSLHPHALAAAEAAEAAAAQGRFWEMHDMLFEHQDAFEPKDLERYATIIGLDVGAFVRDLRSRRFLPEVRSDLRSGAVSGVNGTPTFFINGLRHDAPFDFESLQSAILGAEGAGAFE
jgi:protein-disulfide isomerase